MANRYRDDMKHAQKLSRKIERACDSGDFLNFLEGSHIGTHGDKELEKAVAIFGDCPWTELEFDAKSGQAWIYVGNAKAKIPARASYELSEVFYTLHNC